jgi:hypothetical protein
MRGAFEEKEIRTELLSFLNFGSGNSGLAAGVGRSATIAGIKVAPGERGSTELYRFGR